MKIVVDIRANNSYVSIMEKLVYHRTSGYRNDDIIDAEFTVIYDSTWLERSSQVAFYNHINSIAAPQVKKVVDIQV